MTSIFNQIKSFEAAYNKKQEQKQELKKLERKLNAKKFIQEALPAYFKSQIDLGKKSIFLREALGKDAYILYDEVLEELSHVEGLKLHTHTYSDSCFSYNEEVDCEISWE